ncbi:MAG: amidohydrolase family protein, partial [Pseudomonadota bacterium]
MTYDLIIRGGTIADGTGDATFTGDIAIKDDVIVEVGAVSGTAAREIDATGALVTPGWVDIHTHYDAQATWDTALAPSSWHGVTTAVRGGRGKADAAIAHHDRGHPMPARGSHLLIPSRLTIVMRVNVDK